eukprot:364430-Chlamydomonas_euryale.AAC.3
MRLVELVGKSKGGCGQLRWQSLRPWVAACMAVNSLAIPRSANSRPDGLPLFFLTILLWCVARVPGCQGCCQGARGARVPRLLPGCQGATAVASKKGFRV